MLATGLLVMASGPQEGEGAGFQISGPVPRDSAFRYSGVARGHWATKLHPSPGGPDAITKRPVAITEPLN